jgi:hypothetical protein
MGVSHALSKPKARRMAASHDVDPESLLWLFRRYPPSCKNGSTRRTHLFCSKNIQPVAPKKKKSVSVLRIRLATKGEPTKILKLHRQGCTK